MDNKGVIPGDNVKCFTLHMSEMLSSEFKVIRRKNKATARYQRKRQEYSKMSRIFFDFNCEIDTYET
jgi:hypothetical protein